MQEITTADSMDMNTDSIHTSLRMQASQQIPYGTKIHFEEPVALGTVHIHSSVHIGCYSVFHSGDIIAAERIGRFCTFGQNVVIGHDSCTTDWLSTHAFQRTSSHFRHWPEYRAFDDVVPVSHPDMLLAPPRIGNDIWVGANSVIMRGVTIGDGAVIAPGSVVTQDVAPYEVVEGNPAHHKHYRFRKNIIQRLRALAWWNYDMDSLSSLPFTDVETALTLLEQRHKQRLLTLRQPNVMCYFNGEVFH